MPADSIKNYLDTHNIHYESIKHLPAYTAQEIAASAHIPGQDLAKTVVVKLDGQYAIIVLPASRKVNFKLLKQATGAKEIELARENMFTDVFPDCDPGAMPPFGNLYHIETYVADSLTKDDTIAFNAGSHTELIKMAYQDYEHLVHPKKAKLTN